MDLEEGVELIFEGLKKKGLDQFEVYAQKRNGLTVEIKEGEVDFLDTSQGVGLAIRALAKGRLGFAYLTELKPETLAQAVERATSATAHTSSDPFLGFPKGGLPVPEVEGIYDVEMSALDVGEKIERARILERSALSSDERVRKVRKASYSEADYQVIIANSQGVKTSYRGTICSAGVMALASDGADSQMGWDFDFSHHYRGLDVEGVGRRAACNALRLLGARGAETKRMPILLENRVAAEFLSLLASSFLAEAVQKGKSRLKGKVGEGVFSPLVTIIDDGLYPGGLGTAPVDGEGTPHRRNLLVERGLLTGFLYDSYCANKESISSTGNGVRADFKTPPRVGITNLYMERGTASLDELIREVGDGVLITDVLGMHTADAISGDFSVGCSGLVITGGDIQHPIKGAAISGNILDLFKGVAGVGDDLRFFGPVGSPSLLIREMTVSG